MRIPDTGELQNIYNALADDVSKQVYRRRLLYSILGDYGQIKAMISECRPDSKRPAPPKICYYGAGEGARLLARHYFDSELDPAFDVEFVIDQYKTGMFCGKPIISLQDFLKLPDCKEYLIVITLGKEHLRREIAEELERHGLRYILAYFDTVYFEVESLCQTALRGEYFVDAGALDGETTEYFLEHFENGHAYVFEPNPGQFETTKERLQRYSRQVELFPCGVYDQNTTLRFDPSEGDEGGARISETGDIEVEVRRLDDVLGDRKVTFIKMDIEGSELAALRGAERIIREQRPKLAICIYHKPEDMWELPGLILRYHPDYKLYLRHYTILPYDTVLYAV